MRSARHDVQRAVHSLRSMDAVHKHVGPMGGVSNLPHRAHHSVLERCRAMCLYPEVFFSAERAAVLDSMLRHELVHVRQQRDVGFGPYLLNWFRQFRANLEKGMSTSEAYCSISYEREACGDLK